MFIGYPKCRCLNLYPVLCPFKKCVNSEYTPLIFRRSKNKKWVFNIYLKAYKNLDGRAKPFYRVTSKEGTIKKYIDVLVNPKDFEKKKYRVKATSDNAKTINEKLLKTTTLLNKGWSLYESGNYTWEELVSYLGGTKTNMDLLHFCETIISPKQPHNSIAV